MSSTVAQCSCWRCWVGAGRQEGLADTWLPGRCQPLCEGCIVCDGHYLASRPGMVVLCSDSPCLSLAVLVFGGFLQAHVVRPRQQLLRLHYGIWWYITWCYLAAASLCSGVTSMEALQKARCWGQHRQQRLEHVTAPHMTCQVVGLRVCIAVSAQSLRADISCICLWQAGWSHHQARL